MQLAQLLAWTPVLLLVAVVMGLGVVGVLPLSTVGAVAAALVAAFLWEMRHPRHD